METECSEFSAKRGLLIGVITVVSTHSLLGGARLLSDLTFDTFASAQICRPFGPKASHSNLSRWSRCLLEERFFCDSGFCREKASHQESSSVWLTVSCLAIGTCDAVRLVDGHHKQGDGQTSNHPATISAHLEPNTSMVTLATTVKVSCRQCLLCA